MNKTILLCLISVALSVTLDLETARQESLEQHNYYRAQHQVGDLTRSADLEKIAQSYSEYLSSANLFEHSSNTYNGDYMGECLYSGTISEHIGSDSVNLWYSEVDEYDFNNPGWNYDAGHFTQVVWKDSKLLGCGFACGTNNYCYVTCNYYPGGNYMDSFATNVFPKSTVVVEDNTSEETGDTTAEETKEEETTTYEEPTYDTTTEESTYGAVISELETFRNECTERHNYYRNKHQVGNLVRDTQLEKISQEHAEYMADLDDFTFPDATYNGEYIGLNLFYAWDKPDGAEIVDRIYEGINSYDFNNPGYNDYAGGFTQLVWKNSNKIGCGYSCRNKNCYGICTYYPAGNYLNEFATNVFPEK
jgi:uncharacterized protein YkwD